MTRTLRLAVAVVVLLLVAASERADADDALDRVTARLHRAQETLARVRSYSCTILIRERHRGTLRGMERIRCLFARPNRVALTWQDGGEFAGLRVAYIEGRDEPGTFRGREAGFKGLIGTLHYRFDGAFVRRFYPHHYAPAQTNLFYVVDRTATQVAKARALGKIRVTGETRARSEWLAREADRVETVLSPDPADGLDYRRTVYYFDPATGLPLHLEFYDFDDQLKGLYVFTDFAPNAEIPDAAFDL
jgi:outer membrane lipoprotein-sorting protein